MEIFNRRIFKFNDNNRKCFYVIVGCVWVYRIYQPVFDVAQKENEEGTPNEQYCNKTVYTFAFWLITAAYIFLGLFTSCICCFSIISVILKNEYWKKVNKSFIRVFFAQIYCICVYGRFATGELLNVLWEHFWLC